MLACTEIIKIVEARGDLDQSIEEPGYMAATLEKVYSNYLCKSKYRLLFTPCYLLMLQVKCEFRLIFI